MIRKTLIAFAIGIVVTPLAATAASPTVSPSPSVEAAARPAATRKVVQFGGDVVVVSLAATSGDAGANNIAVERFGASGQPLAWTNPGIWTDTAGARILFPNSAWHFTAVRDVQVHKDHLWILADSATTGADGTVRPTADLLVFSAEGEFKGGRFNVIRPKPGREVIGAGLIFKPAADASTDQLTVVATCPEAGGVDGDLLCMQRFDVSSHEGWYPTFGGTAQDEVQWNVRSTASSN